MTTYFEDNAGAMLLAAGVRTIVRLAIWAIWAVLQPLGALRCAVRPAGLFVAIVAAVALCATYPLLPVGLAIVTAFGWATYPQGARNG